MKYLCYILDWLPIYSIIRMRFELIYWLNIAFYVSLALCGLITEVGFVIIFQ